MTGRTDSVGTTTNGYDANDNLTSVIDNNKTNTWTYDAYNRASTYKDVLGNLIQYRYDANGNMTNLIYPGGKNVYYTFDNDNQLMQVKDWSGRITTLTHDLAGRLTTITRPNGTYRTLGYDAAGQLTNILEQMANSLPIAWCRFNWNSNSTMGWEFAAPLPHPVTVPTRNMTYDNDNRLYQFQGPTMGSAQNVTVDNDGNLTYGPLTNDTFVTYHYDARNRLQDVGGVTNFYDGMNNRIGQTYGTNSVAYVVNPNAALPQVLMRIKNGVTNYYIYGPGLLYQVTEAATGTNTLTYHYDYRGSTVALTGDNGLVTDRIEYSLYATTTYRAGTNDTPFLFNGRYGVMTDPNSLLYMRARYYSPYLCRFLNPDPLGFGGGLNFYAYANGNPVSYLDPFGLSFWSATGRFAEGAAIGAGVAVVVVLAAPEIVAGGAAALVWASAGEISAATATTYASAAVTVGVAATATYGTSQVIGDASVGVQTHNWDQVAFDAGTLTGGFLVGASGGGDALQFGISGKPTSALPGLFGDSALGYDPNYPNGSLLGLLASGPTPQSGTAVLTLTAGSAAQSSPNSWFTPPPVSVAPSSPSSSSGSSSTGK